MPFHRLIIILTGVIVLAALTVGIALALTGALQITPMLGLAGLSLLALCASAGWRMYADSKPDKDDGHL
jgi:uncharacterized membrane protein